jgi:trk system potassium uptake protein TrkH
VVLAALWSRFVARSERRMPMPARLVLAVTAALLAAGWAAVLAFEWDASLAGLNVPDKLVNALFQSVTARTAGFSTVELSAMEPATIVVLMVLMTIGASPGSTGGGIKTTTLVVLAGSVLAIVRGRPQIVLLGRRVPLETVYRSAAIATVAALLLLGGSLTLLATQTAGAASLVFETVSAVGTVGLSLGATPALDGVGKLTVTALMFAGRIGPLTLALLLARKSASRVSYPEARIMVG